jgi:hypothetical protein
MKASVLAMRSFSSPKLCSLSSYFGTSTPPSRAAAPLAKSAAICTWRANGNMSGNRRACSSACGSIFLSAACASALSMIADRLVRICLNTGADAEYMENVMMASP